MSKAAEEKVLPSYQDTGYDLKIAKFFLLDAFKSALNYKPRPDDLFIVTYPKCGTTWVQSIVNCIFNKGRPFESAMDYFVNSPFLEMTGAEAAETMKRPGAIKLHLPFRLTPWSPEAKYIFVARNPKDCVVSFYHHTKSIIGYQFQDGKFDDYFELFMEGNVDFGDYFDTLLSWYEHRDDPNVLFITYEDLKKDVRTNILKIAEFMGQKYKDMLTNDEEVLNNVVKHSSIEYMKKTFNRQLAEMSSIPPEALQNHPDVPPGIRHMYKQGDKNKMYDSDPEKVVFVRKGIVGDYKNYLSPEQSRRLEEKFRRTLKGTDLLELWKDIM